MENIMRLLLYCLILSVFALSLALIIVSNKKVQEVRQSDGSITREKNYPGFYCGTIVLIISFAFFIVVMVGDRFYEYFSDFYFFIIGGMFLFVFVMLIVGLTKREVENFTPSGICYKDGKMGYNDNGECIIKNEKVLSEDLEECKKAREKCEEDKKEDFNNEDQNKRRGNMLERKGLKNMGAPAYGICEYEENGVAKFGYRHPYFGRRCVSKERMEKMVKNNPEESRMKQVRGISYNYNPYQATKCFGFPKDDLLKYDLKCKEKFGNDFGLKTVETFDCAENDNRALCEKDYQMGIQLPANSTKCVPIGTEMNTVCQRKNLKEQQSKYIRMGYKEIKFSGCPEGTQRAICDGNYYDGKELFKDATEPFPQTQNPDRKCKAKCGLLSFSEGIITDNCAVGYIRAKCSQT